MVRIIDINLRIFSRRPHTKSDLSFTSVLISLGGCSTKAFEISTNAAGFVSCLLHPLSMAARNKSRPLKPFPYQFCCVDWEFLVLYPHPLVSNLIGLDLKWLWVCSKRSSDGWQCLGFDFHHLQATIDKPNCRGWSFQCNGDYRWSSFRNTVQMLAIESSTAAVRLSTNGLRPLRKSALMSKNLWGLMSLQGQVGQQRRPDYR
jgi:hypothetical protein